MNLIVFYIVFQRLFQGFVSLFRPCQFFRFAFDIGAFAENQAVFEIRHIPFDYRRGLVSPHHFFIHHHIGEFSEAVLLRFSWPKMDGLIFAIDDEIVLEIRFCRHRSAPFRLCLQRIPIGFFLIEDLVSEKNVFVEPDNPVKPFSTFERKTNAICFIALRLAVFLGHGHNAAEVDIDSLDVFRRFWICYEFFRF